MSSFLTDLQDSALSARVQSTAWLSAGASAMTPAAAAIAYALAALHPERGSDQAGQALATYFLTQLPLALLSGAFAGAMYLEGSPIRRVLIYLAVVGVFVGVGWAMMKSTASVFAPAVCGAVATETLTLFFLGR